MTERDTILNRKFTRRGILELAAAALAIPIVVRASSSDQDSGSLIRPRSATLDNDLLVLPDGYQDEISLLVQPLRRLMKQEAQNFGIDIQKSEPGTVDGHAHDISDRHREIHVLIPDASPDALEAGREVAVHEATHIFDYTNDSLPDIFMENEMRKRTGRARYSRNEYNLFKESSYSNNPIWSRMGHPQDGYDELLASTITVMWFRPAELTQRIAAIKDKKERIFAATHGLVCLDSLIKFSIIPVDYTDLPFDQELVSLLRTEGRVRIH